jgi:enamine deaminase RidA (YjgF/YER057c/UK114 family)
MAQKNHIEALLPVELGTTRIPFARGIRAGGWIFASGILATDFVHGLDPGVVNPGRPLSSAPKWQREAATMYARAAEVLQAAGAGFADVVRTDQYFPDWHAVPFLHQARRDCCGSYIAPSTSILEPGLLLPDAGMCMEMIAVDPSSGTKPAHVYPDGLDVPATSSFVPVVAAGDFVFVAGFMAAWQPGDLGGIAPEARVPEGHLWKGNRIQLEVDYIIRKKLVPALQGAGASLASVVKAQVYLADIEDVPAFNQVWARHFGANIPATTIVPTLRPGFAIADARCEINLIALKAGSATPRKVLADTSGAVCDGHPAAVRAGDLLLFSGMVAADAAGLVGTARVDPRQPYFSSSIEAQMEYLLDIAEDTCRTAGTSLANVVRIQQFHTDLHEFHPACRAWQRRLPDRPLPISAVQVPAPLVVPGCTVQLDLWVYAP